MLPPSDPLPIKIHFLSSYHGPGLCATQWFYQVVTVICPLCRWENRELERLNDLTRLGRAWAWTQEVWAPSWDSSCGLSSGILPGCLSWRFTCCWSNRGLLFVPQPHCPVPCIEMWSIKSLRCLSYKLYLIWMSPRHTYIISHFYPKCRSLYSYPLYILNKLKNFWNRFTEKWWS